MASFKVAGMYRLQVRRADGSVKRELEFPNLITDGGMDALGGRFGQDYQRYCSVGSSGVAPQFTDSALVAQVAQVDFGGAGVGVGVEVGTELASPYYTWIRRTYRFAPGVATGNIAEVGVGWSTGLFSRALVLDELGSPTVITVLADETLDVTYEFRYYPSLTDATGTGLVFTGSVGGTYDWIFRTANAGVRPSYGNEEGWGLRAVSQATTQHNASFVRGSSTAGGGAEASASDIGAITAGLPSSRNGVSAAFKPYVNGSHEVGITVTCGLPQANFPSGVRSLFFRRAGIGSYQVQFDPPIPKTENDVLTIDLKISWSRA